jgi:hypothetical protein
MDWDYSALKRLVGRRVETALLKTLRHGVTPGESGLAKSRCYLTLDDGNTVEFVATGHVVSVHHLEWVDDITVRSTLEDNGFAPVAGAFSDPDQPDGIRLSVHRSELP